MTIDDSSVLGMAFGSAGETRVLMCVDANFRSGCCEELVDLFFQGRRRRLAGGELVKNNFENFCFHFALFMQSLPCRLTLHKAHGGKKIRTGHDGAFCGFFFRAGIMGLVLGFSPS